MLIETHQTYYSPPEGRLGLANLPELPFRTWLDGFRVGLGFMTLRIHGQLPMAPSVNAKRAEFVRTNSVHASIPSEECGRSVSFV